MSMPGNVASRSEKQALASQLAFLYMEKADASDLTPAEFAAKFFEVKKEIYDVVAGRTSL